MMQENQSRGYYSKWGKVAILFAQACFSKAGSVSCLHLLMIE
jgi:hypothetical protein